MFNNEFADFDFIDDSIDYDNNGDVIYDDEFNEDNVEEFYVEFYTTYQNYYTKVINIINNL